MEHPRFTFALGQLVDVEQNRPVVRSLQVCRGRLAAPQAARVLLINPEVVRKVASNAGVGDAVWIV